MENVLITRIRMCKAAKDSCSNCPISAINVDGISCSDFILANPEKSIEIITNWGKEHPEKTILDDFKEKHPNAPLNDNGRPHVCPMYLGYISTCTTRCEECWSRPLSEVQNDKP